VQVLRADRPPGRGELALAADDVRIAVTYARAMTPLLRARQDALLAGGIAVAALVEVAQRDLEPRPALLVLGVVMPLALVWRRRAPVEVLGFCLAASLVVELVTSPDDYPVALGIVLLVAVYSAGAHTSGRDATLASGVAGAAVPLLSVAHAFDYEWYDPSSATNVFVGFLVLLVATRTVWSAGRWAHRRRERSREAIAEREERTRAALRDERARIARELHDVVAHSMSVIVLQARGACHALATEPEEARGAMEAVERTASQTLAEMRRLVDVLRDEDGSAALAPQPSLDRLERLLGEVRAAGLPVELRVEGEAHELPPGVDLCAYRVVQEALTNALKHAGPATARVFLRYVEGAVEVEVTDTGSGSGDANGAGVGLAGMSERVALFGGRLESGPRPNGGFAVSARLPL
jgi:signal transduction histidine kinase